MPCNSGQDQTVVCDKAPSSHLKIVPNWSKKYLTKIKNYA
jgi:hypothetical protein